ncbi:class II glutamine amidotransferase [Rhodobacterales bacterium HKCCSP123]|nr:class II glutamine amidotransferase [Rhodobacterales bacterium HKCCSP123]
MCRVTAYIGPEIRLNKLLSEPDNGLIRQFMPQQHAMLNLAGFGMLAWNDDAETDEPLAYRSTTVPIYDANLDSLSRKVSATTVLAHVRGIPYLPGSGYGPQNLHPFQFAGARLALAHNGDVSDFGKIRVPLLAHIDPRLAAQIRGTTDSEYVYALFLSQLPDWTQDAEAEEIVRALSATLKVLRQVRSEVGAETRSSLNLVICDRDVLVGARLTLDYGVYPLPSDSAEDIYSPYLGLWFTSGHVFECGERGWRMVNGDQEHRAILLSSEPLTRDTTGWVEVPEYSAVIATRSGSRVETTVHEVEF